MSIYEIITALSYWLFSVVVHHFKMESYHFAQASNHEDVWRNGYIAPHIFNLAPLRT
jgi:hypothetical protein